MIVLLLDEMPNYINKVRTYCKNNYNIEGFELSVEFIYNLPYDENNGYSIDHISDDMLISDYTGLKKDVDYFVDDVTEINVIGDIIASKFIEPKGYWTDDITVIKRWLAKYETYDTVAVDFETNGLQLPMFNDITMLSIGWNLLKSTVIVFKTEEIKHYVLNWLVTTNCRQVWHNALYDVRFIHWFTKKMPKNIEDSMLLAQVYKNNVDVMKRKSGLKNIAGPLYGDWARAKTSFDLYDNSLNNSVRNLTYVGSNTDISKYNQALIYYACIDTMATKYVWNKFNTEEAFPYRWIMPTSEPRYNTEQFNQRYYYDYILKPAIPFIIRLINNGQYIDMDKVYKLKTFVEKTKEKLIKEINNSPLVQKFQKIVDQERIDKFLEPVKKAMKQPKYTGFKANPKMRAYVVNYLIDTTYEKLSDKELKQLDNELLKPLKDKQYDDENIVAACKQYAIDTAYEQNVKANRIDKLEHPEKYIQTGFNPYNYSQLTKMWISFGLESEEISQKTGMPSFSQKILIEIRDTTDNTEIKSIISNYIEIAESKNLMTQYIPKYIGSNIDNRVYGNLRLLGTITARLSGKSPKMTDEYYRHKTGINLVTQPASSSKFAKPVKRCFTAPPGKILFTSDYNNLEGHISGILTKDPTKLAILNGKFEDMHTLHACYYFKEEIEKEFKMDLSDITAEQVSTLFHTKEFKPIRQKGKNISFGLDYGAYPKKIQTYLKCDIEVAELIFDRYHQELYKGVTDFKVNYVEPTVMKTNEIHLNWGLKLKTNEPDKDIRTLFNANFQSYSILTQISGIEFERLIYAHNMQDKVLINNQIHDALYGECNDDADTIAWVNEYLIQTMVRPFIINQAVELESELDIGYNLADVITLTNNATKEEIETKLRSLDEHRTKD